MTRAGSINKRLAAYANFAFSIGGLGINIISGLIFVPFYLRYIDDATYGAWFASGAVISVLGLMESGLSTVVTQKLVAAYASDQKERFARIVGAGVLSALLVSAAVCVLGGIGAIFSPQIFGCPEAQAAPLRIAVLLAAIGAGEMIVGYTLGAVPQALQMTFRSGLYFIIAMICGLAATFAGLKLGLGVIAMGLGPVCVGAVMLVGHMINIRALRSQFKLPEFRLDWLLARELWIDARALLFGRVSNAISSNLQSPAAAIAVSAEASTMITLTGRILSLVPLVVDRIGTAAFAGAAHVYQSGREQSESFVSEIMTITIVLSGMGAGLAVCFTAPLMGLWVGESRYAGDLVLWLLVANTCFALRQGAYANLLTAFGLAGAAGRWLGIDAAVRLVLIVGLTPWLGLPGIPGAHLLATIISVVILGGLMKNKALISGRVLWLAGGIGGGLSLGLGVAWRNLVPAPGSWPELLLQAAAYSGGVVLLSAALDRAWRQILLKNLMTGLHLFKRATSGRAEIAAFDMLTRTLSKPLAAFRPAGVAPTHRARAVGASQAVSFRSVYCVAFSFVIYLGLNWCVNSTESPMVSFILAAAAGAFALFPLLLCEAFRDIGFARGAALIFAVYFLKLFLGAGHFLVYIQPQYFSGNTEYTYFWDFMWLDQSMQFVSEKWRAAGLFSSLGEEYWGTNKNAGLLAFMSLNYFVSGVWPLNIVPWNILFSVYTAVLVLGMARSFGASPGQQRLACWILLLLPFNLIANLLWRDTTGQFLIVLGAYLLVQTRHVLSYWLVLLPLAAFLAYLHRDVYLTGVVLGALLPLARSIHTSRYAPLFVGGFLLAVIPLVFLGRLIGVASFGRYMEGGGGIAEMLPLEKVLGLPVRMLRAVMGPFPWTQVFQKVSAYEYQPADYLQHVLNLTLMLCALPLAWRMYIKTKTIDICTSFALIFWMLGVLATGVHSSYVSVGMPLLVPLAVCAGNGQFLKKLGIAFALFIVANIIFVGLGLQGNNFSQSMSGGY